MRATVETIEHKGFLLAKGTWHVTFKIEFTEVELATIRETGMSDGIVYDHVSIGEPMPVTLKGVIKNGISSVFHSAHEAAVFRNMIETETLPRLKQVIDTSASVQPGVKTLEY